MHSAMTAAASLKSESRFAFIHDEAARDNLGIADERAGLAADGDDRHDDAVTREVAAIAKHLVADLAHARHVDEHAPRRRLVRDARAALIELDDVAVLGEQHLRACVRRRS